MRNLCEKDIYVNLEFNESTFLEISLFPVQLIRFP